MLNISIHNVSYVKTRRKISLFFSSAFHFDQSLSLLVLTGRNCGLNLDMRKWHHYYLFRILCYQGCFCCRVISYIFCTLFRYDVKQRSFSHVVHCVTQCEAHQIPTVNSFIIVFYNVVFLPIIKFSQNFLLKTH